ncbi:MAG: TetR/AcrR family transcriptional regulator [Propionibacteriaceae bacterium]|jgi:AcrR family transcriptional regulator|nr:TetR/AcrR family transcriptional regulator [Propionibacteriaceae bacterium]
MAEGRAEYRSSLRSKRLIREAFYELLAEKDRSRITVTDIVNRADISRRTFYAHHRDVRALAELLEDEAIDKIVEFVSEGHKHPAGLFPEPAPLVGKMTAYIESNLSYFRILLSDDNSESFARKLKNVLVENVQQDGEIPPEIKATPSFAISAHFIAGGIVNVFQAWIRGDVEVSLSDHLQTFLALMRIPKMGKEEALNRIVALESSRPNGGQTGGAAQR